MKLLLANFAKMINDSGGLAKVTCNFANEMQKRGHEVVLVYSDDREGEFFFPVDSGVKCFNLRHYKGRHKVFPLAYKLKREVLRAIDERKGRAVNDEFTSRYLLDNIREIIRDSRPDVIIASQPAATKALLMDISVGIPVITMSHGVPEDYFHTYPVDEVEALGMSTACQVLLPSFREAIVKRYPDMRVVTIGNVVPQHVENVNLNVEKEVYKLITVGRLVKGHKRPHLLLEAFCSLAKEFPDWNLEFWGAEDNKNYMKSLLEMVQRNNLEDRVFFKGTTSNVDAVLKQADVFVFPSAYEGFGLTLAEAMSLGLPGVGYKSCQAVNELIQDGFNGYLADEGAAALADKMRILMADKQKRAKMGSNAHESMKQYASENIWAQWENLIESVFSLRKA